MTTLLSIPAAPAIALSEKHSQEWIASAVNPAIIQRNAWSISDPLEVDQLLNRNSDRRWKHSDELVPGWAVAGVDPKTGVRSQIKCRDRSTSFAPDKAL